MISYKSEKKVNNRGWIGYLLAVNWLVKSVPVTALLITLIYNAKTNTKLFTDASKPIS